MMTFAIALIAEAFWLMNSNMPRERGAPAGGFIRLQKACPAGGVSLAGKPVPLVGIE